jgi:hypothetical protein
VIAALATQSMRRELPRAFTAAFMAECNRAASEHSGKAAAARRERATIARKLVNLVGRIAEGLSGPAIQKAPDELAAREATLAAELAAASPVSPPRHPNLAPDLAEIFQNIVAGLRQARSAAENA